MLLQVAPGWSTELERGPDWLFVRLRGPDNGDAEGTQLAAQLWDFLQQGLTHRLVLEMDEVAILRSALIGELVRLHKRVTETGGLMRICGLSEDCQDVLRTSRLSARFPVYGSRTDAVMGLLPRKPR